MLVTNVKPPNLAVIMMMEVWRSEGWMDLRVDINQAIGDVPSKSPTYLPTLYSQMSTFFISSPTYLPLAYLSIYRPTYLPTYLPTGVQT